MKINHLICCYSRLRHRSKINGCVADMHLGALDFFIRCRIFPRLVRGAYTKSESRGSIFGTGFQSASIQVDGFGFGTWLHKTA
jgi:hypothetical protein